MTKKYEKKNCLLFVLQTEKVSEMIIWKEKNLHTYTHTHIYKINKRKENKTMSLTEGERRKKKFHVIADARLIA